ncbi:putative Na+/H+ antiporter [Basilea psittacipulmonis]|uniref:Membrane protein n=1 Tax=Basilea psittacipulmonis DSM 24701 TaxID=1072685 RepID=A0A077DF04_9BURK|nr:putative Na+/H+ antiporter [Basilea psittacipulmonis]AIL33359.1 membrane protein [Basilea psittacipulmonis DSM 24701]
MQTWIAPSTIEIIATILFALAIIHTFSVSKFAKLAHMDTRHSGFWHLMSEVEIVFGVWAAILIGFMFIFQGVGADVSHHLSDANTLSQAATGQLGAIAYLDALAAEHKFTEPLFVFTIMVVASSRPILQLVSSVVKGLAKLAPVDTRVAQFFITICLVPLAGSLITEPAAMTLAALTLGGTYFAISQNTFNKYLVIGVLFVNVSIGGVLTAYAAPPVLMVAKTFGWDTAYMMEHFGWKAAIAVLINSSILTFMIRKELLAASSTSDEVSKDTREPVPLVVIAMHCLFLLGVVLSAHHASVFLGLLMLFIGYTQAYERHQNPLLIKEGLLVGFFLAGLIILGGLQKWWLQDLLGGLSPTVLFFGTTALTAITDNAALTYLGSLVDGTSEFWRYMLVAGAVTGGGLTVIANAPNPAGFSLLKRFFPDQSIAPHYLLAAAAIPTIIAGLMFVLLPTL